MKQLAKPSGFAFLLMFVAFLYLQMASKSSLGLILLQGFLGIVSFVGIYYLYQKNKHIPHYDSQSVPTLIKESVCIVSGAMVTYLVIMLFDSWVNAIVVSGLVGVMGSVIFKKMEGPIFLGSFVGMTSAAFMVSYEVFVAAVISVLTYAFLRPLFKGVGGKAGFSAFVGVIVTSIIFQTPLLATPLVAYQLPSMMSILIALGVFGLMRVLLDYGKLSSCFSSAIVGVILGLLALIPAFFNEYYLFLIGYAFSFVMMSEKAILPLWAQIASIVLITVYFGWFQTSFIGFGGKLGMMAFIVSLLMFAISTGISKIKNQIHQRLLHK
ncbi:MAG: hypothetical protein Q8M70_04720 [bacterium]|nr:hypothetical protein [bacterium]